MGQFPSDVHVNTPLSNISIQYKNQQLISEQVFKAVQVNKESDIYWEFGKQNLKLIDTVRSAGSESNRAKFKLIQRSYSCLEHSLHDAI